MQFHLKKCIFEITTRNIYIYKKNTYLSIFEYNIFYHTRDLSQSNYPTTYSFLSFFLYFSHVGLIFNTTWHNRFCLHLAKNGSSSNKFKWCSWQREENDISTWSLRTGGKQKVISLFFMWILFDRKNLFFFNLFKINVFI